MWRRWGVPVMLASVIVWTGCGWNMKEERREAELDAKSIQSIQIEAGPGDLTIKGDDKATSIRAVAVVKSSGGVKDKDIQFILEKEKEGSTAKLVSKFSQTIGFVGSRTIDVTVIVPTRMNIEVDDDSGDIELTDIKGNVEIDDDSGSIRIRGIGGDLNISDESGDMTIRDVSGSVTVDDGSGDIHIRGVGRDVTINNDGSGSLNVEDVKGKYTKI